MWGSKNMIKTLAHWILCLNYIECLVVLDQPLVVRWFCAADTKIYYEEWLRNDINSVSGTNYT